MERIIIYIMIRPININDRDIFIKFADMFYHTDAVSHTIPIEHHENSFDFMLQDNDYMFAYMLQLDDDTPVGYALLSKSYSNEAGGFVLWLEEFFILPEYRGRGLGTQFLDFLKVLSKDYARVRLELEPDNVKAKKLYSTIGFTPLEYSQMIIDINT